MSVTLDTPTGLDVAVYPKSRKKEKPKKDPRFNVILWNDEEHTFDYVIIMLNVIFGYPARKGFQLASEVHHHGKAAIFTSSLGEAELKRDQILGFGADPLMPGVSQGPIIATLERVPEE